MNRVNVILVAGGRGRRIGGEVAKQFRLVAGHPVIVWTARRFRRTPGLARLIVVAPPEEFARCKTLLDPLGLPLRFAAAGRERQQSVAAGIAALDADCAIAVVHDAVRPLVSEDAIAACIAAAGETGAAILATPVADTVKRCSGDRVVQTVPRAELWLAQTPQAFRAEVLRRAHEAAARDQLAAATDDAALVERLGLPVAVVAGDPSNRKITTADDLTWAEALLVAGD